MGVRVGVRVRVRVGSCGRHRGEKSTRSAACSSGSVG